MPDVGCLLVVAPNWLGDAVMALPAIADARRSFPSARLVVAARPAVAGVFAMVPGVDEVIVLEWNGRWRRGDAFRSDCARLATVGAHAALLLPNSFAVAWLVKRAGIPERWGYASDLRERLLTRAVRRPRRSMHQGAYYQQLTAALGIGSGPLEPALDVPDESRNAAFRLLRGRGWDGRRVLIALAPGAAYGTAKRWIPAHVGQLIGQLVSRHGATCVLVGSRADAPTTEEILRTTEGEVAAHVIDVAGQTSIELLGGILALSRACVSNDSGAVHVAAAAGVPVVALFGPTREWETAPLPRAGGRTMVLAHDVWCRPCMLRECPIDHRCMTGIAPHRVVAAVEQLALSAPCHGVARASDEGSAPLDSIASGGLTSR